MHATRSACGHRRLADRARLRFALATSQPIAAIAPTPPGQLLPPRLSSGCRSHTIFDFAVILIICGNPMMKGDAWAPADDGEEARPIAAGRRSYTARRPGADAALGDMPGIRLSSTSAVPSTRLSRQRLSLLGGGAGQPATPRRPPRRFEPCAGLRMNIAARPLTPTFGGYAASSPTTITGAASSSYWYRPPTGRLGAGHFGSRRADSPMRRSPPCRRLIAGRTPTVNTAGRRARCVTSADESSALIVLAPSPVCCFFK